jgi:hypothetical protein
MATEPDMDLTLLPSPEIPWQWQIGWNRLSTPFAAMDTEQIGESLFVASCGPYVLDFGYYSRRGLWAYVLTICDGPFCGQTPVALERSADRNAGLVRLSHWMAKLAVECDASGATLAHVTETTARRDLTCYFGPPTGPRLINPTPKFVWSLLVWQSDAYWRADAGDASLRFTTPDGTTVSELIFLLRDPYGVYMVFYPATGPCSIAYRTDNPTDIDGNIELTHGGAPLTLPRRMLISRNDAAEIAKAYIAKATGERPPLNFESLHHQISWET